jgi:hypothetical protein
MKEIKSQTWILIFMLCITLLTLRSDAAVSSWPQPPAQDKVQPYTRAANAAALAVINDYVGVFAGSRYAYVRGYKTRLDNSDLLHGEALMQKGIIYVPADFAGALAAKQVKADTAPDYLKDRWVYTLSLSTIDLKSAKTIQVKDKVYVDLAGLAEKRGLKVYQNQRGLLLIGEKKIDFKTDQRTLLDCVITLFDTPDKYADPELATQYIPLLNRQGKWTDHLKVSGAELEILEGPEPEWSVTPRSEYNLEGFDMKCLGSRPSEPGVYPRLLFNEDDLPAIRSRIADNVIARKSLMEMEVLLRCSWLDPKTDDGKVFEKLVFGDTADLKWDPWQGGRRIPRFPGSFDGYSRGIYSSHIEYNSQCLVSIVLYSLIKGDDDLGRKAAGALVNLYKLQEPVLDKYLEYSDSELGSNPGDANGSTTHWRGMHAVIAHMDLPFALDFGGKWMTSEEKRDMYRIIAKATYGRRTGGGDGPRRAWRDINHVTWHLTHLLAVMSIEGQKGFDAEAYASGAELTADFLEWGIDKAGTMYESNGKSGGGLQFQVLSMIALARRGDNLWGHPHWRKLMESQVLNTSPNGKTTVSSGTWSGGLLATPSTMIYHTFYPNDRFAEFLLSSDFGESNTTATLSGIDIKRFDLEEYRKKLENNSGRVRLPSPNYPGMAMTLIYDTDWKKTARSDLKASLDFIDPQQGIVSGYSENSKDAVWMNMMVRPNHYMGAGHHHADAGMFHFSADSVNWITESPFQKTYDGRFHNEVLIDGIAEPDALQGRADWLGTLVKPQGVFAAADLKNSYTWVWANQFILFDTEEWGPRPDQFEWFVSRDPAAVKAFQGTQRYKMRPWWPTGIFSNWFPVLQRKYNPVEYAYRSAGLIRGQHSYGLVVDDIKKDDKVHLYQWSAMPGAGVWAAETPNGFSPNMLVLTKQGDERAHAGARRFRTKTGDPMLLICLLGGQGAPASFETGPSKAKKFALDPYKALAEKENLPVSSPIRIETQGDGPLDNTNQIQSFYDRIVGGCYSKEAHFRTLLIPFHQGEKLPEISYSNNVAIIKWDDQQDRIIFNINNQNRTFFGVERNGARIIELN